MKKYTLTLFVVFLGIISIFAQAPQAFKYQAVARDNLGRIIQNQIVGLRISILKDSPLGATMYMETHSKGTNEFGIVTLNVGGGTIVTGNFNTINWSNGEYFIKTELDIAGTGSYEFIGTTQLLSVPFAIYANEAGKAKNDNDTSSTNELQTIIKTGNTISLSQGGGSVTDSDNQILNLNGFDLSISEGNTIQLPPDTDHDTLNEIQAISKTGNQITLSKNGGSITDSDNQTLSLNGNQLTISDGNTLTLSGAVDLDSDPTNELQLINRSNDTLYLSQGNFVVFPHDADRDSTNEIQVLQLDQNVLSLSKANAVNIDADTTNEIQVLSLSNDSLYLSGSNNVKLAYIHIQNSGIPVGFSNTCNISNEGLMRYNSNSKTMQYCNGQLWIDINATIPLPLTINETHSHITEQGANNGSIQISISGGVEPYIINWSNGLHTTSLNNLTPNSYTVTVTDANLLSSVLTISIYEPLPITDIDGNSYNTIFINNTNWMQENLKTTKKPDGTTITRYCYQDNSSNCDVYGGLYLWNIATQVCPTGWHLPSQSELTDLISYLGGNSIAGGKMKEGGFTHWTSPNTGATNESKFLALPGGYRQFVAGGFTSLYNKANFWSATSISVDYSYSISLTYDSQAVDVAQSFSNTANANSVRCIKD